MYKHFRLQYRSYLGFCDPYAYSNKYPYIDGNIQNNGLTERDVIELNIFFHKNYTEDEWRNLKALYLAHLPEQRFPESVKKLPNLTTVDLLHAMPGISCISTKFDGKFVIQLSVHFKSAYWSDETATPVPICLDGYRYSIINVAGSGAHGDVFYLVDDTGKKYVLKVFQSQDDVDGDWLALSDIRYAKDFVSLPLIVNKEYKYSLYRKLGYPWHLGVSPQQKLEMMNHFDQVINPLLRKDGLTLGDNLNTGNYMVDDGKMVRIDFDTLRRICLSD